MAQISFRVEDDVKKDVEQVCKEIGISLSTAINVYLVKIANERRIPFELAGDPFYSKQNIAVLERRIESLKSGKSVLEEHDLISVDYGYR